MPKDPVLLLDCYLNPAGAEAFFDPWLRRARRTRVHALVEELPDNPSRYSGIVVTGSAASVYEEAPWSIATTEFIRAAVDAGTPLLGVCYGHQLLGEAIGGRGTVRRAEAPEVGYLDVQIDRGDPLFDCFPERFTSFLTHGDEVVPTDGFEVWGRSEQCPVQAIRVPDAPAWGVQFHNEYPEPEQLRLLRMREGKHPELGFDAERMFAERSDTAVHARAMFDRFLEICGWP